MLIKTFKSGLVLNSEVYEHSVCSVHASSRKSGEIVPQPGLHVMPVVLDESKDRGLQPLYQLRLLLYEKGMLWGTDSASPAAPSAQGSGKACCCVLSPLKGERESFPGASGRNASAHFFGRKHQGHKTNTQISSNCLTCLQKSESVTWLTVPLCLILAALQRVWPAHCAHAHCPGEYLHV